MVGKRSGLKCLAKMVEFSRSPHGLRPSRYRGVSMKHNPATTGYSAHPMQSGPVMGQEQEDFIDLRAIFGLLWRGKYIILTSIFIAGIIATLIISDLEPRYIVEQEFGKDTLQNQIEILRSKGLIQRVIDDQDLDRVAEFNPTLRVEKETVLSRIQNIFSVPPELQNLLMDIGIISAPPPPPSTEVKERRERLAVVENVRAGLSLKPVPGSRVIDVSFTSGNPDLSSRMISILLINWMRNSKQHAQPPPGSVIALQSCRPALKLQRQMLKPRGPDCL